MKKLRVKDLKNTSMLLDTFEGKLSCVIALLQEYAKHVSEDAEIIVDPYGYDGPCEYTLVSYRDETDSEYKRRKDNEKRAREKKKKDKLAAKERRHEQYLKLKKEFGDE